MTDAPERTPLSERIRALLDTNDYNWHGGLDTEADAVVAEVAALEQAIARISAIAEPETRGKRPLKWIRKECVAALTKPEGE